MRQKPNFGVGVAAAAAAAEQTNSRLNLESQFERDAERDEGQGGTMIRGGAGRKGCVKPPSSLAIDTGKKTPRGGDRYRVCALSSLMY